MVLARAAYRMFVPSPKFCVVTLIPTVKVFGAGAFGRHLGHEGRALMKEISTFLRAPVPVQYVRTQWNEGHLQTRKWFFFTRHRICWRLNPGYPDSRTWDWMSSVYKPPTLCRFVRAAQRTKTTHRQSSGWHQFSTISHGLLTPASDSSSSLICRHNSQGPGHHYFLTSIWLQFPCHTHSLFSSFPVWRPHPWEREDGRTDWNHSASFANSLGAKLWAQHSLLLLCKLGTFLSSFLSPPFPQVGSSVLCPLSWASSLIPFHW